jgi:biotin carboxyl carrier protein
MKREVTVDGKTYQVELDDYKLNAPFTVKVNGKPVEVVFESEPSNQEAFNLKVKGKKYAVELPRNSRQASFTAKVNSHAFKIELKTTARQTIVVPASPTSTLIQRLTKKPVNQGAVTAPMSGKIIKVKVKKGDAVKVGDVLCTLEAMKMENEVTASTNGVVEEVMVQEGKTVNTDDILIVIK